MPSGFDLDNNGDTNPNDAGNDAWGFGLFPGQFGMVVYSKHPIDAAGVRTFQDFLWKDMPGSRIPQPVLLARGGRGVPAVSKSHWDVPVQIGKRTVHFLVSHPTRRCSTDPRTATACATRTRSASGPTT